MKTKKQIVVILIILVMVVSGCVRECDDSHKTNPYPTLEPEAWEVMKERVEDAKNE